MWKAPGRRADLRKKERKEGRKEGYFGLPAEDVSLNKFILLYAFFVSALVY